jgi:hypothetical protein
MKSDDVIADTELSLRGEASFYRHIDMNCTRIRETGVARWEWMDGEVAREDLPICEVNKIGLTKR